MPKLYNIQSTMSLKTTVSIIFTTFFIYSLYAIGIQTFLAGFLLKRIVLSEINSKPDHPNQALDCRNISHLRSLDAISRTGSINFRSFDKVIVVIIDALRFDFTRPSREDEFYLNRMPVFQESLERRPNFSILYRCRADPPTTTLQRLKAMTTGSMPTFIDVSKNFASERVDEDNVILQMKSENKRIVFMGDDTWEGLFPNQFHRSYPYPSFNVKDLDSVDDGVLRHLFEEMKRNDSDVIIAHFLGVDHCGHRYGPTHPEMARKLRQMNSVIRAVMGNMSGNSLLFVLGDHGMTETGDHGGDSDAETSSALFVFSPNKIIIQPVKEITTVSQMDIVPTLSLLLNLPIPFSNLGVAITPLLDLQPTVGCMNSQVHSALTSALALRENSVQVQRFLEAYSNISSQLPLSFIAQAREDLNSLSQLWAKLPDDAITNPNSFLNISDGYRQYLDNIQQVYAKTWTTFDVGLILMGCAVFCFALVLNLWTTLSRFDVSSLLSMQPNPVNLNTQPKSSSAAATQSIANLNAAEDSNAGSLIRLFAYCLFLLGVVLLCMQEVFSAYNVLTVLSASAASVVIHKRMTNKFKSKFSKIIAFFNMLVTFFVVLCANSSNVSNKWFLVMSASVLLSSHFIASTLGELIKWTFIMTRDFYFPAGILVILFATSFSNSFIVHEDKTILCILLMAITFRFLPLCTESIRGSCSTSAKPKSTKKNARLSLKPLLPPLLLASLLVCVRLGTLFYRCREEQAPCVNSDLILGLERLYGNQSHKAARLVLSVLSSAIPWAVFAWGYKCPSSPSVGAVCVKYGALFVCVMTCLRWWLNVIPPQVVERILKGSEVILNRASISTSLLLLALLLACPLVSERPWELRAREVYGGSVGTLAFVLLQILHLVSGDALSPAVTLMALSALLYVVLVGYQSDTSESQIWLDVAIWSLLSRHWFYATAHQPSFPSIQWDAAFLLSHKWEASGHALSAALVALNTFAPELFFGALLPALYVPRESVLFTSRSMQRLHMKYLLCSAVKVLGTIIASFLLRRHLMVWKIFSPKLLFEVLGAAVTAISLCLGHSFMAMVVSKYHKALRLNLDKMFSTKKEG